MQGSLVNFRAQPAESATRQKLGLKDGALALEISWANSMKNKPPSPLHDGDVVIAINGNRNSLTVGAFTAYLFREASGHTLQLTVIRQGQTKDLELTIP